MGRIVWDEGDSLRDRQNGSSSSKKPRRDPGAVRPRGSHSAYERSNNRVKLDHLDENPFDDVKEERRRMHVRAMGGLHSLVLQNEADNSKKEFKGRPRSHFSAEVRTSSSDQCRSPHSQTDTVRPNNISIPRHRHRTVEIYEQRKRSESPIETAVVSCPSESSSSPNLEGPGELFNRSHKKKKKRRRRRSSSCDSERSIMSPKKKKRRKRYSLSASQSSSDLENEFLKILLKKKEMLLKIPDGSNSPVSLPDDCEELLIKVKREKEDVKAKPSNSRPEDVEIENGGEDDEAVRVSAKMRLGSTIAASPPSCDNKSSKTPASRSSAGRDSSERTTSRRDSRGKRDFDKTDSRRSSRERRTSESGKNRSSTKSERRIEFSLGREKDVSERVSVEKRDVKFRDSLSGRRRDTEEDKLLNRVRSRRPSDKSEILPEGEGLFQLYCDCEM